VPDLIAPCGRNGNVTTAHDLSPISAALAGYDLIIAHTGEELGFRMQDVIAEVAKKTALVRGDDREVSGTAALDNRYGQIGISAVAAAVRYQGGAKNPAYAPCSNKWRDLIADVAA
jgi:hypothetical protein